MSQYLVTAMNGATARFFTLESTLSPEYDADLKLVEHEGIVSPERSLHDEELWADTKTGRNRGASGQAHSYDDHRQNHRVEMERRFAQSITTQLINLAQIHQVQQLVLVAEPRILGLMRDVCIPLLPKQLKVNELTRDLCHLKPQELHTYLAEKKQLPARRKG
jgi:protein required for attachment to host cells